MEYGLIGRNLAYSYSAKIHNMLGTYDYELCNVEPDNFDEFIKTKNFKGLNITIPYKQKVIEHCDSLSDAAKRIGSVNTVIVDKFGNLEGYNTDYHGVLYMIESANIKVSGKKVLILGGGGTSKTAKVCFEDLGAAEIVVVTRNGENNYLNIDKHYDSDIIINTTPVGTYPNNGKTLIDLKCFKNCTGVLDVIYNPLATKLIEYADELSIPHSYGLKMLVAQAKYASELFTGEKISDEKIDEIYNRLFNSLLNICLIGMPGSGKTVIGSELAKVLGREFIDTDKLIEEKLNMKIPEIFSKFGEKYFRDIESEVIEEVGKKTNLIIATGGGVVLSRKNYYSLCQNGFCVFVDRDLDKLARAGRPLSKSSGALKAMYEKRLPLYKDWSMYELKNDGTIDEAINSIIYKMKLGEAQ